MAKEPSQLREEIERTRRELGETIVALARVDIKTRAKHKAENLRADAVARARTKLAEVKPVIGARAKQKIAELRPTILAQAQAKAAELKPVIAARAKQKVAELKPVIAARAKQKVAEVRPAVAGGLVVTGLLIGRRRHRRARMIKRLQAANRAAGSRSRATRRG